MTTTEPAKPAAPLLDTRRIMEMLPHRFPMLLIDRVLEVDPSERALALKNVTINEDFFNGHFPGAPVMPGVLIIEAMAQTAAALVVHSVGKELEGKLVYFMAIDEAKFRRPVTPGDQLKIEVVRVQNRRNVWKFKGEARVDGELCAEAIVTAMIMDGK
ncbi:MAG TPA: 3-hydroxyacyl-ACP dehydratase FabZ [Alphaproteobacteria bacterium]|nr:3-hydroxyacyl-ACP dehydratase FabZ [Alphaproteobacteria bacterium]HCS24124.1 3-hydroxyacyl-[acyl-carrier-protein] dehydratase FabZ [Rhodospirillaceae bacterium]HRI76339.1 3-hydroxyacyl-ACP dehydratase FabZ [Alphaproteobacteria bacterium]HRJ66912.1 3-hydroxyacyl-ACP dehydratase FabZ [Alphaproteobacteria bacterium]